MHAKFQPCNNFHTRTCSSVHMIFLFLVHILSVIKYKVSTFIENLSNSSCIDIKSDLILRRQQHNLPFDESRITREWLAAINSGVLPVYFSLHSFRILTHIANGSLIAVRLLWKSVNAVAVYIISQHFRHFIFDEDCCYRRLQNMKKMHYA